MEYESAEKPEMLVGAVEADDVDDVEGFLEIARLPALLTLVLLDALGYPNDKGRERRARSCSGSRGRRRASAYRNSRRRSGCLS